MLSKRLLIFSVISLSSICCLAQNAWGKEVFLNIEEKPLRYVLNEIRNQTDLNLIYNDNLFEEITLSGSFNSSAESALSEILSRYDCSFKKFENNAAVIYRKKSTPKKFKAVVRKTNTAEFIPPSQVEILKPILLSKIDLVYPQEAINKRIEGETLAKLFITKEGKVSEVLVEKSSGHQILDTATINYVNKLKFLPAEYKGKYKSVWITMLVKFSFE